MLFLGIKQVDFPTNDFASQLSTAFRRLLFVFAADPDICRGPPKKKEKRSSTNDNTPFVGGALV